MPLQATSSCLQKVTDMAANPDDFQNKIPCADRFILLSDLLRVISMDICTCQQHFSHLSQGGKNKDWKGDDAMVKFLYQTIMSTPRCQSNRDFCVPLRPQYIYILNLPCPLAKPVKCVNFHYKGAHCQVS